eukprot:4427257-Ditylum_brightwellii.AAC.1
MECWPRDHKEHPQDNQPIRDKAGSQTTVSAARIDTMSLRYWCLNTVMYTNTMYTSVVSLKDNKYVQIFSTKFFIQLHPIPLKYDYGRALQIHTKDVGAPNELFFDNSKEQMGPKTEFIKTIRFLGIK